MKYLSTTIYFGSLVLLFNGPAISQGKNEIPNADFEEWTDGVPANYGAFQPPNKMFQTIFRSSNAPSGKSSLRIANVAFMGQVMPGGMWYCKGDCSTPPKGMAGFNRSKFPVTRRYKTLCGYYKANLKGRDKLWISISMFNDTVALGGSDAGAIQLAFITKNTSEWKRFEIPITYPAGTDSLIPNSAFLEIAIVNTAFPQNPYVMQGTAGSEVFIDKLSFCQGKEDILVSLPKKLKETFANYCHDDRQTIAVNTSVNNAAILTNPEPEKYILLRQYRLLGLSVRMIHF